MHREGDDDRGGEEWKEMRGGKERRLKGNGELRSKMKNNE